MFEGIQPDEMQLAIEARQLANRLTNIMDELARRGYETNVEITKIDNLRSFQYVNRVTIRSTKTL